MKTENYKKRCQWRKQLTGTTVVFNAPKGWRIEGKLFGVNAVRMADSDLRKLPGPKGYLP